MEVVSPHSYATSTGEQIDHCYAEMSYLLRSYTEVHCMNREIVCTGHGHGEGPWVIGGADTVDIGPYYWPSSHEKHIAVQQTWRVVRPCSSVAADSSQGDIARLRRTAAGTVDAQG